MIETRISEQVFEKFPGFRRGIVFVRNMQNTGTSQELESWLNEALEQAASTPIDLKGDPRTKVWQDTYRALGVNPNKFPPAHLALLKRVQKPGAKIPFINKAVAIMNDNSIRGVLPVGGDDASQAGNTLELRHADGSEIFTPLSNPEKQEHPDPDEVIYIVAETGQVMCRRWNWRNSYLTRITEKTQTMVMNIDGLGENIADHTLTVRDRVARMLEEFCLAETETALLTPTHASHRFRTP
jgi:lysyl-tRNA synthetase class 2